MFTGEANGLFKAYDAETGVDRCGSSRPAPASTRRPSSYTVDGKQYVVVGAGGNTQIDYKRGNSIIAFTTAD